MYVELYIFCMHVIAVFGFFGYADINCINLIWRCVVMRLIDCTTGYDSDWIPKKNVFIFEPPSALEDCVNIINQIMEETQ